MLNVRTLVAFLAMIASAQACSCIPGAFELENSLDNNEDAAAFGVGREITPQPRPDINAPRFWEAKIVDVFKGCNLADSGKIVIKTGGNSALCGVVLEELTQYLLIGSASIQEIEELNYNGIVLNINSCTLQTPFADLTRSQLSTLYALPEPNCNPINCETCPQGYFDGCNSCICSPRGGFTAACTRKFCPPGTETEPTCNCGTDTKTCPDGTIVNRDVMNGCEFEPCPTPTECCDPNGRPGFGSNPICFEGTQCCPDGQWSCSIGDGKSFPCGGEIITEGFGKPCDVPIVCAKDTKPCPDGSTVSRDPEADCQFPECEAILCTADVKTCPDGGFVSRNPKLGCAFDPCPDLDCETCPFGFFDGCNNCGCGKEGIAFCTKRACSPFDLAEPRCNPEPVACPKDLKVCLDGSTVSRDPNNDCEFLPCPPVSCKVCPFGYNDGCNDCQCDEDGNASCTERFCLVQGEPSCFPEPVGCTDDVFECPDGSFVSRDPENDCKFEECVLPDDCFELDGCYLVDLSQSPPLEFELEGEDEYKLVDGKSEYSLYCEVEGPIDQFTFYYPNGAKDRHEEWSAPFYMRGDSGNWINRVPYLSQGCGTKSITVEGKTWRNRCFSTTFELEAVC